MYSLFICFSPYRRISITAVFMVAHLFHLLKPASSAKSYFFGLFLGILRLILGFFRSILCLLGCIGCFFI